MKHANVHIIGIPKGEDKEKGIENVFEQTDWKHPKHKEGNCIQVQEP